MEVTGHPFCSDLIPQLLQSYLFTEKSQQDMLILEELDKRGTVSLRFIAFLVTIVGLILLKLPM